jgi:hypothetical protein
MFKLTAACLVFATSLVSLPGFAQEAAPAVQADKPQAAAPAPAPQPVPTPPAAEPATAPTPLPLKRSVIGRRLPVHPPAPAESFVMPVFVDDVRTLANLVSEDKDLAPAANNLAARRNFLRYFAPTTAIVSAGLLIMGSLMRADTGTWDKTNTGLTVGGGGLLLLSSVIVGAVYPTRSETYDVINAWNHTHPDRPIFP